MHKFEKGFNNLWRTIDLSTTKEQQNTLTDMVLNAINPRLWIIHDADIKMLKERLEDGKLLNMMYEFHRQAVMAFTLEDLNWETLKVNVMSSIACSAGNEELDIDDKTVEKAFADCQWLILLYILHYGNTLGLIDKYREEYPLRDKTA